MRCWAKTLVWEVFPHRTPVPTRGEQETWLREQDPESGYMGSNFCFVTTNDFGQANSHFAQFLPLQNENRTSIYFIVLLQGLNELIFGNVIEPCLITELSKVGWGHLVKSACWVLHWGPLISDTWWPLPLGQKTSQKKTLSFELHDTSGFCSYKCLNQMFLCTYHRRDKFSISSITEYCIFIKLKIK